MRRLLLPASLWQRIRGLWQYRQPGLSAALRLTPTGWLASVLLLGGLLFWLARRDAVMGTLLVVLLLLWSGAYLWARAMMRQVRGRRALRYLAVQVGDVLEEELGLANRSLLPVLWAELVDHTPQPVYALHQVRLVDGRSVENWAASTVCARRGVYTFGPWEIRMGDPLHFFQISQIYEDRREILVYPPLAVLPPHLLPRRKRTGDALSLRLPLAAETINAGGTRPYVPGDPVRHIHWRTTARRNALHVKNFDPEASTRLWLVLDADAAAQVGEGNGGSFEVLATLTASLASSLLNERLSVGLFAGSGLAIPPRPGKAHLWNILHALARLEPQALPLEATLAQTRALVSERDSVIVLTASLQAEWRTALRTLARGARGGPQVLLLDPASFVHPAARGQAGRAAQLAALLQRDGVRAAVIARQQIRVISGSYGQLRRWEFTSFGTGRVVVRRTPRLAGEPGKPA
ncbi:MAG TPA: DUF58 domain-containing protein [Anaerolineaceae bacterium]|nr:DUF58 domain-containing protein [Anaerolineaceae bacterium]HPN51863.1 DUF58 domain-containing protein [Anaerolineaceae bacterium]